MLGNVPERGPESGGAAPIMEQVRESSVPSSHLVCKTGAVRRGPSDESRYAPGRSQSLETIGRDETLEPVLPVLTLQFRARILRPAD